MTKLLMPQGKDGTTAAQAMEFERAAEYRDLIQAHWNASNQATGHG